MTAVAAYDNSEVIELPSRASARLAMKVAIAVGPARRFVVGDHLVQLWCSTRRR